MESNQYQLMADFERNYWWHVGRLAILRAELARRLRVRDDERALEILNVGCGTGGTIRMLETFGRVSNVDVSDEAIDSARRQGFLEVVKVVDHRLPYPDNQFDVVAAFDVLEHIEDDEAALVEWLRVLRPGGMVLLTVPAYQWLWSSHDVAVHHHRRYHRKRLRTLTDRVGLEPIRLSYAIVFSLPLVAGYRLLERLRPARGDMSSYVSVPTWLNRLFTAFLRIEARLHGIVGFPAGSSIIATLRRPAPSEKDDRESSRAVALLAQPTARTNRPICPRTDQSPGASSLAG